MDSMHMEWNGVTSERCLGECHRCIHTSMGSILPPIGATDRRRLGPFVLGCRHDGVSSSSSIGEETPKLGSMDLFDSR